MVRLSFRLAAAFTAFVLVLTTEVPLAAAQGNVVVAQQQQQMRRDPVSSFFRQLFGGFRREPRRIAPAPGPGRVQPGGQGWSRPSGGTSGGRAPQPQPQVVAKDPDAQRVAVFGDFFASGLADGLEAEFAENAKVAVDVESNASSGLVRDDHFDWPAAIEAWLDDPERRIDAAVVLIGANDRQAIRREGPDIPLRSEAWQDAYIERIDEVIDLFRDKSIPLYWVGLPPVQSAGMSQDYAYFNEFYRERAYRAGTGFVDIWNGFVDENGKYTVTGPDVNGEQRQLRRDNGLHMTDAGNRKLAHFVARDIRRTVGGEGDMLVSLPQGPIGPKPYLPGEEEQETGVGEVLTLTGGAPAASGSLVGGPEPGPQPPDESAYYDVILMGHAPEAKAGRTDDFSWPRGSGRPEADGS